MTDCQFCDLCGRQHSPVCVDTWPLGWYCHRCDTWPDSSPEEHNRLAHLEAATPKVQAEQEGSTMKAPVEYWYCSTCDRYHELDEKRGQYCPRSPAFRVQAERHNTGKPRMGLLPPKALKAVAEVLSYGAAKYQPHNWRKGLPFTEVADSLLRHLFAWLDGEDNDQESGLSHLAHAATNALFLLELQWLHPEMDDRPTKGTISGSGDNR